MHLCALQLYEVFLDDLPAESISIIPNTDYPTVAFSSLYSGAYHIKSAGHVMVKYPLPPSSACALEAEKMSWCNDPGLLFFYR